MGKTLSIIIPTYNMENYLRRCLDSLIVSVEYMPCLEVLVINDGSKDSSSIIAHDYEKTYPQIFRVIDKDNGNYGSCINCGLKEISGKYVKILDADDYFATDSLEDHLRFLNLTDADLVLTCYVKEYLNGKQKKVYKFSLDKDVYYHFEDICTSDGIIDAQMHAITYKTINLRNLKYHQTEGISYTDQEWIFIPMTAVKDVTYQPIVLYHYLIGREGQTMQSSILNKSLHQQVICARNRLLELKNRKLELSESLKHYLFHNLGRVVSYVYRATILRGLYDYDDLCGFDYEISKLNPDFYHFLDNDSVGVGPFKLHYIRYFRKNKRIAPRFVRVTYTLLHGLFK